MDEKRLLKFAVQYLSKYDSSKKNLSDVLKRKIFRLNINGLQKNQLINSLGNILLKLEKNKLIDDNKYSVSKILSLSSAGRSKKYIYNYLIKKGINKIAIQDNLKTFQENNHNWELISAKLFARKKRLLESNDSYEKKLSKMARAGFSYDICKKVLS